ncbi:LPS assembly lipoprotein LptE [Halomonas urumqiensis]|uniref:LPS-assembly lipoprotein LptE n=1 Tax=Halomonas urumqiensis TaxID=1684789 RepID=A0A2N7UFN3_9GAMM|nr:LPS assembly lipoprotein LptE [Halomonas urumqiensis]PMR79244.1 hypothetical protein C1H70_13200 [Halomonas urumqiensis]PTB03917.1 hypothetical protein C6V82_05485 [Halomonas urumqiensis]GHE19835.1 hypothetical protein GCM10017767_03560 [Halomonas urumqiensis]
MQRRHFLTLTLAGVAAVGLGGCGFRLRGSGSAISQLDELAIAGVDSDLSRLLRRELEGRGTRVTSEASRQLNLGTEEIRQYRLSVLDAGSQEEEMTLRIPFSVQRREDAAYLLSEQTLAVSTRYTVNSDNLLTQQEQRDEARDQLRQDAAHQLVERLNALAPR